jgi:2-polyprenyl-6-methoxyphenol hydroxylase-like FAD-dependent oxidoreductase
MQNSRNPSGKRRRRIAIVGGGQAGLQLALGLTGAGYAVTLTTECDADALERGTVRSTQCMFDAALRTERRLGLDHWHASAPQIRALDVTFANADGTKALAFTAPLRSPAQSVDQRVKLPRWLRDLEARGGAVRVGEANPQRLEELTEDHDLVVVASGRGALARIFERETARSPYNSPQRALAVAYVDGTPRGDVVRITIVPEVGELFAMPCLTLSGPCEILFLEAVPGGPFDAFDDVASPSEHLDRMKALLAEHVPWEADHAAGAQLTDAQATLSGRFAPVVRRPTARLPSGRSVLGLADAVVLNDPITGQGSNTAGKSADIYLREILARGPLPFDESWMEDTAERAWEYQEPVTRWTNAVLGPPPRHVLELFAAAATCPAVAERIGDGFDHPPAILPLWESSAAVERLITGSVIPLNGPNAARVVMQDLA